jgi:hypothetical protein
LLLLMMIFVVGGGVVPPLLVRQQHWKLLEAAAAVVVVVVVVAECRFRRPHHTGCHLIEGVVLLALFLLCRAKRGVRRRLNLERMIRKRENML